MRLDVLFTPGELVPGDISDRTVVVLDVLRASSTIVEALASGARALYPVGSIEEAIRIANTLGRDGVLLCGERKCLPIEGFDLGNSPGDFTAEKVGGKTLVMSTTNGTAAMTAAAGAARVLIASWLNLSAVVDELARSGAEPLLLCSGRDRQFALEDAVCAGEIARRLADATPDTEWQTNDGALAAMALARAWEDPAEVFAASAAGQAIVAAALAEDLPFCAQVDRHDLVPVLHDRQVTLSAPGAALSEA
ncbi:MAG TPA: 2-phosphosulfolactate phosphatase [Longimicrobiaceae bacterium]|jgi:2-phosphosulfolactate phosphatase|nr:2-phosphosulfolactate phosphatase [Longimicrobiaceae bacterium]